MAAGSSFTKTLRNDKLYDALKLDHRLLYCNMAYVVGSVFMDAMLESRKNNIDKLAPVLRYSLYNADTCAIGSVNGMV